MDRDQQEEKSIKIAHQIDGWMQCLHTDFSVHTTLAGLAKFDSDFSPQASALLKIVIESIFNTAHKHKEAIDIVNDWAKRVVDNLTMYAHLRQHNVPDAVCQPCLCVLDEVKVLGEAVTKLDASLRHVACAAGNMTMLVAQVTNDFKSSSTYYEQTYSKAVKAGRMNTVTDGLHGGAFLGAIAGPFGVVVGFIVAAVQTSRQEAQQLRKLRTSFDAKLAEIADQVKDISARVASTQRILTAARSALERDQVLVYDLNSKRQVAQVRSSLQSSGLSTAHYEALIAKCNKFIELHTR
ncbi:hypothetical protein SPRG_04818 [Saprolegnia parasitica CBS 223.65]|uniref:Uncharacterized protein n=1 Tax=Saprolegnia parasitica (strain CBS 223.65) TaxID=695850 RepID=A0A067CNU0_SAPPC|nr:hypothetical protein SPRG_04818 [Saprolegnia parasitica CBS 223.65]KDO30915.1 hypothetical protein SPRG_04818 [Saprolegnia parasitica CBS 223.65]|eukprot:XP_012198607.1 hypothetical protein SPRG_04818 [Saprolegnia parasitica CBS 223.65]